MKQKITDFIASLVVVYAMFVFVSLEPNPFNWMVEVRAMYLLFSVVTTGFFHINRIGR